MAPESSSSLIVDAIGVRVGIDLDGLNAGDRAAVRSAWEGARASDAVVAQVRVTPNGAGGRDALLSALSSTVTQAAIEERRGDLWMLHAAGLAAPDGGVVVLVGPSGAGKTTATGILAKTWGYVSDEAVGIEHDGQVWTYRKPLSVITAGRGHKVQHSPGELGLRPLPPMPLHVRRFVLLDRRTSHTRARLIPVPLSEALIALAPHSSALAAMPRPLRTVAGHLSRTGGVLRAEYAEATDLAALVRDLMTPCPIPPPVAETSVVSLRTPDARASGGREGGVRYRRADVVDAHDLADDRLAVLTGESDGRGVLRILAGAAPALWRAADGVTRDALLEAVTAGMPSVEAGEAVDGILVELVDAGLLVPAEERSGPLSRRCRPPGAPDR